MNIAPRKRRRSDEGKNGCIHRQGLKCRPSNLRLSQHSLGHDTQTKLLIMLLTSSQEGPPTFPHLCLSAIRTPHPLRISVLPFNSSILRSVTLRRQLRCLRAVQGEDRVFRELLLPHFLPFASRLREEIQVFGNRTSTSRCWHRASDLRQRQHKRNSGIQCWGKTQIVISFKHLTRLCQAPMFPTYLPGVRV